MQVKHETGIILNRYQVRFPLNSIDFGQVSIAFLAHFSQTSYRKLSGCCSLEARDILSRMRARKIGPLTDIAAVVDHFDPIDPAPGSMPEPINVSNAAFFAVCFVQYHAQKQCAP